MRSIRMGGRRPKSRRAAIDARKEAPDGDLVLVTAITPTPAGEGKTTTTIGLTQALQGLGHRAISATREPSLGPVFGVKGGAAGGGYAQVLPMEDINLHFTGDFAAISAAHNLLAAMLDNHLHQGNALGIDARRVLWRRAIDMNDRSLHGIVAGLGGRTRGVPRETGFDITPASEVMAVLCLARDLEDLKARFARIAVAERRPGDYVTAADLTAHPAMAILMREALLPNLVQNLEGGPALIHGGPFGNIAHGCNSLVATRLALKLADLVVTEAGFGADLGAEKFFNIKCPAGGLRPRVAVLVATVRALKLHGGANKRDLASEDLEALRAGMPNLAAHAENLRKFGVPVVIAVNRFPTDTDAEVETVMAAAEGLGAPAAVSTVFSDGGSGGEALARQVVATLAKGEDDFKPLYEAEAPLTEKIETVAREIYGADGVDYAAGRGAALAAAGPRCGSGLPGVHGEDAVLAVGQPVVAGAAERVPGHGAGRAVVGGGGVRGAADGRHSDYAGAAPAAVCGGYGYCGRREDQRAGLVSLKEPLQNSGLVARKTPHRIRPKTADPAVPQKRG